MKKKILYPLLAGALILMSIILLESMTKKTVKAKRPLTNVTLSVVNRSSVSWTQIDVTDNLGNKNTYYPSGLPCTCFPTGDGITIKVYFSSTMTGAIQIVDANLNPLGCSPSGTGSTRTLPNVLGSSTSAEIDIYSAQGCP